MTTKTLTIVRSQPAEFGNTANQTTSTIEVDTAGSIAIHARNASSNTTFWQTFNIADITSFACAAASDGSGRQVTVTSQLPDGSHSVVLLLAWKWDSSMVRGGEMVISSATNRGSTAQGQCGTHTESVDINNATSITLT